MDILIIVGAVLANIIVLAVEGFPVIRMLLTTPTGKPVGF